MDKELEKMRDDYILYDKITTTVTLNIWTLFKRSEKIQWICMVCGYVHEGYEAPKICPSCNHAQSYYKEKTE